MPIAEIVAKVMNMGIVPNMVLTRPVIIAIVMTVAIYIMKTV